MTDFSQRWAWVDINLGLIQHNTAIIAQRIDPTEVWAVVKAGAYGHGAVQVSQAALTAGATGLCVALVEEAIALRAGGISAPILLLSEQPASQAHDIVLHDLVATVSTAVGASAIAVAAAQVGRVVGVHMKIDTGMHRVGVAPSEALALAQFIGSSESLRLDGIWTHFAVADTPSHPANAAQLQLFTNTLDMLASHGVTAPCIHAANSASALTTPNSRFSIARIGIAMYGLLPGPDVRDACAGLIPVMSLRARVSALRWIDAGEAVSYGLRRTVLAKSLIATIPLGYADGVPRRLWESHTSVLINGIPREICGTVSMDQLMVDCGSDSSVTIGDEVVLFGSQGEHTITPDDWAARCGTIGYEIVCGISARIHRRYV
ncbi:MAG: alanine racemase [Ilumatobacteraceae bacterium]|nr:alanine racemase [Ilumatobacteraceae bacterium]